VPVPVRDEAESLDGGLPDVVADDVILQHVSRSGPPEAFVVRS
jgi:hypothetical protein